MNFESLANELLLDMFEYLPAVHLLRAFHQLNARLDNLIVAHFQTSRLDFQTASKQDFNIVCQINLPLIIQHIVSLGLSDHDETPQQIQLFRSYGWNLNRFEYLRSLSLNYIRSVAVTNDILLECPRLSNLNLTGCYFGYKDDELLRCINRIWSLPKLIYCYLNMNLKHQLSIPTPTAYSSSIEHLSVVDVSYPVGQLIHLYEHTPNIRYLMISLHRLDDHEELRTVVPSIIKLSLAPLNSQREIIQNVLQYMPNLSKLKIETLYVVMNGYEWEQIIRNYLPKLKVFQLKMSFQMIDEQCKNDLFTSFQTPFWLEENQWFIRYHDIPDDESNLICLYTLPYSFSKLGIYFPVRSRSTFPNDKDCCSYGHVRHLSYRSSSSSERMNMSNFQFPNINTLTIKLPINDHLLSLVRKLDRLYFLEVLRPKDMSDVDAQSQLQALLDHAIHLSSLKFNFWSETEQPDLQSVMPQQLTPVVMKSHLIRQLHLLDYYHWFTEEDCFQLSHSSLGIHCEVLYIAVEQRTSILYLINTMCKLRTLIVRSEDDSWTNYSSNEDELDQWLEQNLPYNCSIRRDSRFFHRIRIWIR